MLLLLLVLALLGEGVHMAPLPANETAEDDGDNDAIQDQLDQLLKDAMLNDAENVKKIADRFNLTHYEQILCISVRYTLTCTEEEECDNATSKLDCSNGHMSERIWLSFDPDTTSGKYLLHYAVQNWEVLGLDWQGACDLSDEAYLRLHINVQSLTPLLCGVDLVKYVSTSLNKITEQVSLKYRTFSGVRRKMISTIGGKQRKSIPVYFPLGRKL